MPVQIFLALTVCCFQVSFSDADELVEEKASAVHSSHCFQLEKDAFVAKVMDILAPLRICIGPLSLRFSV